MAVWYPANSTSYRYTSVYYGAEFDLRLIAAFVLGALVLISFIVFCCKPRNCTICWMNIVRFCYEWSCFRLDCASKLNPNVAILRYEEDPPLEREQFIQEVISNNYIKSILNTFAILLPEYFLSILPSGSLREGFGKILPSTAVLASDFDVMLVPDAAMAGEEDGLFADNEKPLFAVVESTEISPGFVWLRLENEYLLQWEKLCIRRHTKGSFSRLFHFSFSSYIYQITKDNKLQYKESIHR